MTAESDIYFIEKVLKGDKGAYSYLVNRYSGMVYSMALKFLKSEPEAEDLAQEVFVSAFKSLVSFKGNAKFSTWIYRITYNKAISQLRKNRPEMVTDNDVFLEVRGGIDHSVPVFAHEDNAEKLLGNAIKMLPDNEQVLIMLHYYEDQSMEEIASISGMSVSNVKVKLFRIRKKLKELLVSAGCESYVAFD